MRSNPLVFLDTNVLLSGFGASLRDQPLPRYLTDGDADRVTFEKCVFEAYLAFRGVGGKKPDEGRGRWAEQFLTGEGHPQRIAERVQDFHGGDRMLCFYWTNEITAGLIDEATIDRYVREEDRAAAKEELERRRQLLGEEERFERLCGQFLSFLRTVAVRVVPYLTIFGPEPIEEEMAWLGYGPHAFDSFARDTVIPAEDLEIVYAAMRLELTPEVGPVFMGHPSC